MPPGTDTRPTTDRVRESVFSLLASRLHVADRDPCEQLAGLSFLDLYAGSGAMGFEAYSRGAKVTWVDKATARIIEKNKQTLGVQGLVMAVDVTRFLHQESGLSEIVWLDPPYTMKNPEIEKILGLLDSRQWIKSGGIALVERSGHTSTVEFPESFLNVGLRRYGDTVIYYAEKGSK